MTLFYSQQKKYAPLILLACFFIIDRFLKAVSLNLTAPQNLTGEWFKFSSFKNSGVAFSFNPGLDPLWLIIPVAALALVWLFLAIKKQRSSEIVALTAILLGAFSNLYDRLVFGAVIDYLEILKLNVSNLADWLIVFGAAWLVYAELLKKKVG